MKRMRWNGSAAIVFAALVVLGCGDADRFLAPVPSEPERATLFDLFHPLVERPAAFDVVRGRSNSLPGPARTDLNPEWDFLFAFVPAGASGGACFLGLNPGDAVFLPRGCFEGLDALSGILRSDLPFDELREAPGEVAAYETARAVRVAVGAAYVVRSRPDPSLQLFGAGCRRFAKFEILELDPTSGSVTFRFLWNPNCGERRLTPGS
ncbi:MAG: hypothetical protein HY702_08040 [Gemmatimonadetes bacterium]|nr:hypothetical protein [Gemmatimonadota bacterium]